MGSEALIVCKVLGIVEGETRPEMIGILVTYFLEEERPSLDKIVSAKKIIH